MSDNTSDSDTTEHSTDDRCIVTDGGRDERFRTRPTNDTSGRDVPLGGDGAIVKPHINPPQLRDPDAPNIQIQPRPQVILDDDSDDDTTVTACMDCLEYFPTACDSWERCPMCGSGLVDVHPAGDPQ